MLSMVYVTVSLSIFLFLFLFVFWTSESSAQAKTKKIFMSYWWVFILAWGGVFVYFLQTQQMRSSLEKENSPQKKQEKFVWKMIVGWPSGLPILGKEPIDGEKLSAFAAFKNNIAKKTNDGLNIDLQFIDEVPKSNHWQLLRKVQENQYQIMHSASYYYMDNLPPSFLFSAVPFGMDQFELQQWIDPENEKGGYQYWVKLYEPLSVIPFEAGHTGQQMGGWFKRRVRTPEDFRGLRMRIGGIGGNVVAKLNAKSIPLSGAKIQTLLQETPPKLGDVVDAAEWIGPYHDEKLGFPLLSDWYYYSPGWQEPDTMFEITVNKNALEKLPKQYSDILRSEIKNLSAKITRQFNVMNERYDKILRARGISYEKFSPEILCELRRQTDTAILEQLQNNELGMEIWSNYKNSMNQPEKYVSNSKCVEIIKIRKAKLIHRGTTPAH